MNNENRTPRNTEAPAGQASRAPDRRNHLPGTTLVGGCLLLIAVALLHAGHLATPAMLSAGAVCGFTSMTFFHLGTLQETGVSKALLFAMGLVAGFVGAWHLIQLVTNACCAPM